MRCLVSLLYPMMLAASSCVVSVTAGDCSTAWKFFEDACYFMNAKPMSWLSASRVCEQLGGGLAFPDSPEELRFLSAAFVRHLLPTDPSGRGTLLVGCDDRASEGVWSCSMAHVSWNQFQPDNNDGNEDCVEMFSDGRLNDIPCDGSIWAFSICEVPSCRPTAQAFCHISTGASLAGTRCNFDHQGNVTAPPRHCIVSCGRVCQSDPECRSFDLVQLPSAMEEEFICKMNDQE